MTPFLRGPARGKESPAPEGEARANGVGGLRRFVHRRLLDSIEQEPTGGLDSEARLLEQVDWLIEEVQDRRGRTLAEADRARIRREILDEMRGLGPLAPLMADPAVSDILVNGPDEVWVDRGGRLERTEVVFDDERHLRGLVDRLVAAQGKHLDAGSPHVDARLDDGSRLHAVIPPLCAKGTVVSIRRFRLQPFDPDELLAAGYMSAPMLALLKLAVEGRSNIAIAGGAAAGKTTLLNLLSRYIPPGERIVTVEETSELRLQHPHVVTLEARPANMEGRGAVGLRDLLRTALRMRADRIVVGEVRGEEVLDMLQAMNVGHDGSLTTVHASNPGDVLRRLESLALLGGAALQRETVVDMVRSAVQLIVFVTRFRSGQRRITSIHEVLRGEQAGQTRELFRFEPSGVDADGVVHGEHVATARPAFVHELVARGFVLPGTLAADAVERAVQGAEGAEGGDAPAADAFPALPQLAPQQAEGAA